MKRFIQPLRLPLSVRKPNPYLIKRSDSTVQHPAEIHRARSRGRTGAGVRAGKRAVLNARLKCRGAVTHV